MLNVTPCNRIRVSVQFLDKVRHAFHDLAVSFLYPYSTANVFTHVFEQNLLIYLKIMIPITDMNLM